MSGRSRRCVHLRRDASDHVLFRGAVHDVSIAVFAGFEIPTEPVPVKLRRFVRRGSIQIRPTKDIDVTESRDAAMPAWFKNADCSAGEVLNHSEPANVGNIRGRYDLLGSKLGGFL